MTPSDDLVGIKEQYMQFIQHSSNDQRDIEFGKNLLVKIRTAGQVVAEINERELYAHMARDIGDRLLELTGEYLPVRLEPLDIRKSSVVASETMAQVVRSSFQLDTIPEPAPLPIGSRMPLGRNPLFVGRVEDLKALARTLMQSETTVIRQIAAVTGLGGIGKTNLATEFVHRYGQFFTGGVFWLNFADPAGIPNEIVACGSVAAMDLPGFTDLSQDEQVWRVLQEWQKPVPRLLIYDNCEDEVLLSQWRPRTGGCRILVTSRRAMWDPALGMAAMQLTVLPRAESVALLHKFRSDLSIDDENLDAIAAEVGDLPLALHLAGSFLARYRYVMTLGDYLMQLRSPTLLLHRSLQTGGVSPTGHLQNIARTIALSYEQLDPVKPVDVLAIQLLARAAHFSPGVPIPRELLLVTLDLGGDVPDTKLQVADALTRLVDLGLLDTGSEGTLRLHRLLAVFIHGVGGDEGSQAAVEHALISAAYQINTAGYPTAMQPIYIHLRYVTDAAMNRTDDLAATLCGNLGYHLQMIGDYVGAQPYFERTLAIDERVYGSDHPDVATDLNNLVHVGGDPCRVQSTNGRPV